MKKGKSSRPLLKSMIGRKDQKGEKIKSKGIVLNKKTKRLRKSTVVTVIK